MQVAGALTSNVFKNNKAGTKSTSAAYRMQSYNKIEDNKGLSTSTNFENNNPNWSKKPAGS